MQTDAQGHYTAANDVLKQLKVGLADGSMSQSDAMFITHLAIAQSLQGLLSLGISSGVADRQ